MKAARILLAIVATFLLFGMMGTAALAQTYPPTTPPIAPPIAEETEAPKVEGAVVNQGGSGAQGSSGSADPLAFTGAELTLLLGGVGVLLAGGAVALIAGRRRAARAG